jgi:hypothetical protein
MTTEPSSQVIERAPYRVKRQQPLSPRVVKFLVGWFFGWPLLVFAYNPLAAPYDPLTLFIVVPGGAIWLTSCGLGCDTLATMAKTRWPVAKTILEALSALAKLLMYILLVS